MLDPRKIEFVRSIGSSPNEMFDGDLPREQYKVLLETLKSIGGRMMKKRDRRADDINIQEGVTFLLKPGEERILPVDWVPRLISADDWSKIEAGLTQRVTALNAWLTDLYAGKQKIVPEEIVKTSLYYYPDCEGLKVPHDIHIHIYGPDLVHMGEGRYIILEDNTRIPSGASYALKYREISKRLFMECFAGYSVRPISDYTNRLRDALMAVSPREGNPFVVLLSEGSYNAAYYDHKILAERMGFPLVEPVDLEVDENDIVWLNTSNSRQRVDVIYRRIQDLDFFVPGLSRAYCKGNVNLANSWGSGVVDDKGTFPFTEAIVKHYTGEDPILPIAPTFSPLDGKIRKWIIENLETLVVKSREGYGGHDLLIGPESTKAQRADFARRLSADPGRFIAQECLDFSTHCLTKFDGDTIRLTDTFVDIRTYIVSTPTGVHVMPGGITRVAQEGTRIVNSSSGGMIKDTWVLAQSR